LGDDKPVPLDTLPLSKKALDSERGGRKGFGEAGTPFEQEKDPLIKRETLELARAYYKIREARVRKRIFEMVKAVGAASHADVLGSGKVRKTRRASS
jgi:hypothetical protein